MKSAVLWAQTPGRTNRFFAIVGDGEMQEGQVWEAAMLAGAKKLDNLCVIADYNFVQSEGSMEKVMSLESLMDKMEALDLLAKEVNAVISNALLNAFDKGRQTKGRPTFIKANMAGQNVSSLEKD